MISQSNGHIEVWLSGKHGGVGTTRCVGTLTGALLCSHSTCSTVQEGRKEPCCFFRLSEYMTLKNFCTAASIHVHTATCVCIAAGVLQ